MLTMDHIWLIKDISELGSGGNVVIRVISVSYSMVRQLSQQFSWLIVSKALLRSMDTPSTYFFYQDL